MTADYPATEPVAIVGTGRIACAIGRLLQLRGEPIAAIAGRSHDRSSRAASFIGDKVQPANCADLPRLARRVIIAVPDAEIAGVAETLKSAGMRNGLTLHTSGALGPNVLAPLRDTGVSCGVLHPLQSVASAREGVRQLTGITYGLGGDPAALTWSKQLTQLLDSRWLQIEDDRWGSYHSGAVLASNGLVALMHIALRLFNAAGIDSKEALEATTPLIRTTLQNINQLGVEAALTGPVARGDVDTIALHLAAMAELPAEIVTFYQAVSLQILAIARLRGLPESLARQLEDLLRVDAGHA